MAARIKQKKPVPPGCAICNGEPHIRGQNGFRRCSCARGKYYSETDKKRRVRSIKYIPPPEIPDPRFPNDWELP